MSGEPDGVSLSPSSSSSSGGSAGVAMGGWGSGGAPRPLSANVRRLHRALQELLSAAERERFLSCLNGYRARRNVCDLVGSLQALLDAPEKKRLLPLLRLVIPRADQLLFDQYTSQGLYLPDPHPTPWPLSQGHVLHHTGVPGGSPLHFAYEYGMGPRVEVVTDGVAPRRLPVHFPYEYDGGSQADEVVPGESRQDFLSDGGSRQNFLTDRTAPRGSRQDFLSNGGSRQDFQSNTAVPGGSRQHFLSNRTAPRVSQENFLSDEAAPRGSRQDFLSDRTVPRGLRQNISTSDGTAGRVAWQDLSPKSEGTAAHGLEELPGEVRQVTLRRVKAQEGLGFSIRGGSEHGVGIYVSLVEPGSLAEKEGLRVGDKILTVNDKPLDKVTHAEAVKVLKGSKKLNLSVHSMGRIPGGYVTNHIYTWVDPQGRSISPPTGLPQHQSSSLRKEGEKRSHLQLLQEGDEKKVNLVLSEGRSLGLMIRGGAEYALGIYITGVDKESEAESTGLKVGDQILEVNGRSFLSIPHDEAVKLLKSSRHLIMTVKDVGRLPHARTTVDETKWITSSQIEETVVSPTKVSSDHPAEVAVKPSFYRGLAGSQVTLSSFVNQSRVVLEEQARHLLNEPERATMGYYLDEYKESNIPVDALVMALFELLNTHAKFSLLSEVRGMISPQDLDRFDNLVLKREIEFMKARQPSGTGTGTDSYSMTSYGDTVSSTGSHFTSTTVSSARERLLWLIDLMENTSDLEGAGNGGQGPVDALPDISLDDVSSFPEEPPAFKPLPPSPSAQSANPQNQNTAKETLVRPSSESSQSGLFFVAHRNPTPPPSLSEKDTASISSSVTTCSTEDSASSTVSASVSSASRRSMDAHLALVNQHPIGPFPRVQSPTRLKNPTADTTLTTGLSHSGAPSPSPPPPPLHPAPPPPVPEASAAQHFIMVEVHQPNSEPDVNEVRSLPQARASTLSQLSDSGQTLSEDSGVDIGEAELGTRDRSRLLEPVKSRSPLEAPRTDRVAEAALKPPGLLEPTSHLIRVTKTAPTLGIAIEGGANTRQPLPRIVTIQRGGSAHNCGKLKVGHVILEVNGVPLRGKEHRQAARIIAEAFKAKDKDYVDFQVTEFNIAL